MIERKYQAYMCVECGAVFQDESLFAKHVMQHVSNDKLPEGDLGYCGVSPIETGPNDPYWKPACQNHDQAFETMRAGQRTDGGLQPLGQFFLDSTGVFLRSLYGVAAYAPYLLIGGVGGLFRWAQQKRQLGMEPHLIDKDNLDVDG